MKGNELMIGDWVRMKENHDVAFRMEDVSGSDMFRRWTSDGEYMIPFSYGEIEPIPITPEILEKNGFKKQGFDGWEFDYLTEGGCLIYEVLWRCDYPKYHTHLTIKSYSPDFGSFKSFRIDSVHELQHALRLCGIDKEIVL